MKERAMTRLNKFIFTLTVVMLLSNVVPAVDAGTILVGNTNDVSRYAFGKDPGNASPSFPDFAAGGTYQQVYDQSAFPGSVTINQISFASSSLVTSGPGIATYNCTISLSTTSRNPNALTTNLPSNRGADFVQVFSGPIVANLSAKDQFDLIINITPFMYDPAIR